MKKVMVMAIVLLTFTLAGCGNEKQTEEENTTMEAISEKTKDGLERNVHSVPEEFVYVTSDIDNEGYRIDSYEGEADILDIPDEYEGVPVIEIKDNAFSYTKIAQVNLGSNIQKLGEKAFIGCNNLSKVKLNEGLKIIGEAAFLQTALEGELLIPDSVEKIESIALAITNLESIVVGRNVNKIEYQAFASNSNLKTVIFHCENADVHDNDMFEDSDHVTIIAAKGSTEEKYAKDHGIDFEER